MIYAVVYAIHCIASKVRIPEEIGKISQVVGDNAVSLIIRADSFVPLKCKNRSSSGSADKASDCLYQKTKLSENTFTNSVQDL